MKSIDIFLSDLRQIDVQLWVEGDRLRYRAAKEAISPELLAELKERKAEILAFLQQANRAISTEHSSIVPVPRNGELQLSVAQKGLWLQSQLEPDNPITNMPYAFRFQGVLNVAVLEQSQNEIIRRHEILRTTFPTTVDGQPSLAIAPELLLSIPILDLRELRPDQREVEAQRLANQEVRRPFEISQGPLLRLKLLCLEEEDHILIFNMHRIVCDGSSSDIFFRELIALYQAFSANQPSPLLPLPIQYADFAHWQRQWLQGEVSKSQLNYWKQQLKGDLPVIQLPTDYLQPPIITNKGARFYRILSKSLNEALNVLSQQSGCTLFMTLVAAFQVLLYCYIEQEEILVSYTIAGREQLETEDLIAPLSNTLVLRTHLSENLRFRDFLARVRETILESDSYQNLPFETLFEEIMSLEGHQQGRSTLTRLLFALLPSWKGERGLSLVKLPGLTITNLFGYVHIGQTKFDLTLVMRETDLELQAIIEYNSEIFKESTIAKMLADFQTLLNGIVLNPEENLRTLALEIPKFERSALPIPEQLGLETKIPYVAPRNKLEFQLTRIWEKLLSIHPISIRDNFFAIGGNSLLAVRLFAQIEEVFQIKLPLSAIFQYTTIEKLALILELKIKITPWYSLIPIQPLGSRPPLFGIHHLDFKYLSHYLGQDQPIYGLRYGMGAPVDSEVSLPKMEDLAAHYIEEMRSFQSEGPYFLMGYSFGGLIAYEMAQQLVAQGQQLALLAIIDTFIQVNKTFHPIPKRLRILWQLGFKEIMKRIRENIKIRLDSIGFNDTRYYPYLYTQNPLILLKKSYTIKSYAGQMVFFKASNALRSSISYTVEEPEVGWKKFVGGELKIYEIPSHHFGILKEPDVEILAEKLRDEIDNHLPIIR